MKYKVILPIDIGDGKIHGFGETIDVADPEVAKAYSHALQAIEPTVPTTPAQHPATGIIEGVRIPHANDTNR